MLFKSSGETFFVITPSVVKQDDFITYLQGDVLTGFVMQSVAESIMQEHGINNGQKIR
jgi:hypothetical protein